MCERIAGAQRARRFFPLVMTIFLFIMVSNWVGILPGFGTVGWIESPEEIIHHAEEKAEKASEHADLNDIHMQVFEGEGGFGYLSFGSAGRGHYRSGVGRAARRQRGQASRLAGAVPAKRKH